jgi:hypothetical protein
MLEYQPLNSEFGAPKLHSVLRKARAAFSGTHVLTPFLKQATAYDALDFSVSTFGDRRFPTASTATPVVVITGGEAKPTFRNLLSAEQEQQWKAYLEPLVQLLTDSQADELGATIYIASDTLMCEIGRPGRTLLIAIDEEGSLISYRKHPEDFDSYHTVDSDRLPELEVFLNILFDFQRPETSAWMNSSKQKLWIMKLSDAAFATTQSTMEYPTETEASVSWLAPSWKADLERIYL